MSNNVEINIKTAVENQKDVTELQKELIKLGQSSEAVDQQVEELTSTLTDLTAATKLKESLESASQELEKTTENLEKAKEAFQQASEEAKSLAGSLDPKALKEMNKVLSDQEKELKRLEQAQARAQKKYSDTNKAIESSSDSVKELINDQSHYENSLRSVESSQRSLNSEIKKLTKVGEAYKKLGVQDLESEISELEKSYKVLEESGKLSSSELRYAHERLTEEIEKHKRALNGTDQAYKNLKTGAIHLLPVIGAFAKASKSAIDYEDAMADVKKVITATDEEFKGLSDSLLQMSKVTPVSAAGLAKIAAAGAQLGVEVGNLKEFVTITSDMATAFDMTAEDAGKAVASLSNIFGITINDTKELGDAINYLSNNSAAEAKQIVDVLVRIGGTGKAVGLTQQEVAALGSTLIAFGKSPEIAGTAIDAFLAKLQMLNTLGPTGKESLDKLGISAVEMSQKIRDDASGAIVYFLEQVNQLENSEKSGVLTNIFGRGPQADILLMASNVGQLKSQLDLVSDSYKYLGSMQDESNSRAATTANQIIIFKNNIDALSISLGSKLLPTINKTVSGATSFVDAIARFTEMNPEITRFITYLTVAAAGSKLFGASIALAGAKGKESILSLVTTIKSANSAMGALDLVLKAGIGTLSKFILPVMALDLAFNTVISAISTFTEHMKANAAVLEANQKALKMTEDRYKKLAEAQDEVKKSSASLALQQTKNYEATQVEIDAINQLSAELERLGLSYNAIEKGISKEGDEAISTFERISDNAFSTSRVITQSFGAALEKIKTPEEFFRLTSLFNSLSENGKIASDTAIKYSDELNNLNTSIMMGSVTEADFLAKKTELVKIIAEQVNGFAALNQEISKQISLINTQIQQDKQIVDSMIKKLEAEKALALARGDSLTAEQLSQQIETARIKNMERESVLIREIVSEYQKELNVLLARKANGEALNEQERERIKVLQTEITARQNEAEAIKIAAQAKEADSLSADKNVKSLNSLASASKAVADASKQVSDSSKSVNDELKSTNERVVVTSSLLNGMADESKMAKAAMDDLKSAMNELNRARAVDAVSMSLTNSMTHIRRQQLEGVKKNIADEINYFNELEGKLGSVNNASLVQIQTWERMVTSMKYVNEDSVKSVQRSIESMKNSVLDAYASIDQENANLMNKLTGMRNQSEEHQLRMRHFSEVAEAERKLREAQEAGDFEKEQKLKAQLQLIKQIQVQEQRNLRDSKITAQEKNQKLDINLNGTHLNNLDPNNAQDMNKIAEAVVSTIKKSQQKSMKFRIKG